MGKILQDKQQGTDFVGFWDRLTGAWVYASGPPGKAIEIIWALGIGRKWNNWRCEHGLVTDPTAGLEGQGLKNLIQLHHSKGYDQEFLARAAERYLSIIDSPDIAFDFEYFFDFKPHGFEYFMSDEWKR